MQLLGYKPTARFIRDDSEVKFVDDFGNEVARGRIDGKRLVSFEGTPVSAQIPAHFLCSEINYQPALLHYTV